MSYQAQVLISNEILNVQWYVKLPKCAPLLVPYYMTTWYLPHNIYLFNLIQLKNVVRLSFIETF